MDHRVIAACKALVTERVADDVAALSPDGLQPCLRPGRITALPETPYLLLRAVLPGTSLLPAAGFPRLASRGWLPAAGFPRLRRSLDPALPRTECDRAGGAT